MVAQLAATPSRTDVRLVAEIRGAPARLWNTTHGEIVISGPAGTGKTRAILEWIHWRCQNDRLKVLILRKTLESLKTSALVTYQEQVLHDFDGKRSRMDGVTFFGGNDILPPAFNYEATGSRIVAGGMDQASKVKSTEWDIVFANETTELTVNDWESVTGRTDRPSLVEKPPSMVVGDCNPDAPSHWIKHREAAGNTTVWYSKHEDNPAMWDRVAGRWTESGARYLARLDKLTGVRKLRMRYGKWVAAEGQVFDAWDRSVHVIRRDQLAAVGLATPKRHIGGVDWGWTKPGVITVAAIGGDGQVAIVHEVYRTRMGREWWIETAKHLRARYDIDTFVCDPSEPEYIDAWVKAGLPAVQAVNDILPGITAIQDRLVPDDSGRIRWLVVEDCNPDPDPELLNDDTNPPSSGLQEIDVYIWAKGLTGRKEKPVDADNHCLIAGTMVETEHGPKPIEQVKAGERVWTRVGLRSVSASGLMNPSVQVYTVRTDDGSVITGSSNHPVWVDGFGWKYLDTLRYGDILHVWNQKQLSSTELPSGGTQTPSVGLIASTSRRPSTIVNPVSVVSTKRFGRRLAAQFPTVARFITTTLIRRTTNPAISFVSRLKTIKRFTGNVAPNERDPLNTLRTWIPFGRRPLHGTEVKRGGNGIARTRPRCGWIDLRLSALAIIAERATRQFQLVPIGSVLTPVSPHGGVPLVLMTRTAPATFAAKPSESIDTRKPVTARSRVVNVTAEPNRQPVYNLTVAGTPEFFANGILVHNSLDTWRYLAMEAADGRTGFEPVPDDLADELAAMGL